MHFHFLSELDHLIATAQANTGDGNGLCQDPGNVIDLLAPGLCAVQAQLDENGLSGDVLAGMLSTDLCSMIDPI